MPRQKAPWSHSFTLSLSSEDSLSRFFLRSGRKWSCWISEFFGPPLASSLRSLGWSLFVIEQTSIIIPRGKKMGSLSKYRGNFTQKSSIGTTISYGNAARTEEAMKKCFRQEAEGAIWILFFKGPDWLTSPPFWSWPFWLLAKKNFFGLKETKGEAHKKKPRRWNYASQKNVGILCARFLALRNACTDIAFNSLKGKRKLFFFLFSKRMPRKFSAFTRAIIKAVQPITL